MTTDKGSKIFIGTLVCLSVFACLHFFLKEDKLEVYALKYGESLYHSKNIYLKDKIKKHLPLAWMFYLIKYDNKVILVDTGFRDKKFIKSYKIDYQDPLTLLAQLDVTPDKVTDVIITHAHFDHIGNVDLFTNSRIYIQEEELQRYVKNLKNRLHANFFKTNHRIIPFENNYKLYDFFNLRKIGGHSVGSSVVFFDHNHQRYIITGDECYLIDNCLGKPIGSPHSIANNKAFIEWAESIPDGVFLPLHDRKILNIYPLVGGHIAKII